MQKFNVDLEVSSQYVVELSDSFFFGLTEKEWLKNFSQGFFKVESMKDIVEHVTLFYANHGSGFLEGIGEVSNYAEGAMALVKEVYRDNDFTVTKENDHVA